MNLALRLSGYFYEFEKEYFDEIVKNRIDDKIAWFIIKLSVFYYIYHQNLNDNVTSVEPRQGSGKSKAIRVGKFFLKFWKNWFHVLKKSKRNKTIVIPLTIDKRLKDGKFKNVLFDELILEGIIEDPLVLAISKEGILLEPSCVGTDIYLDHLSHLTTVLAKRYSKQFAVSEQVDVLYRLVLRFLKTYDIDVTIEKGFIIAKLSYCKAECNLYKKLFKNLKPKTIVVTDQSFAGKIQAANDLNIKVVEFQHGLMDKFYPHYTLPREYSAFKKNLVLADKIVVFGEFHRQQVLEHGFWNENDVIVVGNVQINEVRNEFAGAKQMHSKLKIIFPTQGRYSFSNTIKVLEQLSNLDSTRFEVIIRPHPLEPDDCLSYYRRIVDGFPVFQLKEERVSIYSLIFESDVVLGFDSTTLLEAIAMGKPAITIASAEFPRGIHSMLRNNSLEDVIMIITLEENNLVSFLEKLNSDNELMTDWKNRSLERANFLYNNNYLESSKALFEELSAR
jgi:hypothetical protein